MQAYEKTAYKKSQGSNSGSITYLPKQAKPYLALTAISSSSYKTLRGAEAFMIKNGYEKA